MYKDGNVTPYGYSRERVKIAHALTKDYLIDKLINDPTITDEQLEQGYINAANFSKEYYSIFEELADMNEEDAYSLVKALSLGQELKDQTMEIFQNLYKCYKEMDCSMLEIN